MKNVMKVQSIIKNDGACKISSCKECPLKNNCSSDGISKNKELIELSINYIDNFLNKNGIKEGNKIYLISFYNYSIRIEEKEYRKENINKDFPNINEIWKSKEWASNFLKKQFPKILNELEKRNTLK